MKALCWLLLERKQYSYEVVASFLKRIMQVAFHCPIDLCRSLVAVSKVVINKYPRCVYLVEDDNEGGVDAYSG